MQSVGVVEGDDVVGDVGDGFVVIDVESPATGRAREVRRRLLGNGTPNMPQSVNFYKN